MIYLHKYNKYINKLQKGGIPPEWINVYNESTPEIKQLIDRLYELDRLDIYVPEYLNDDLDRAWFIENATREIARPDTPEPPIDLDPPPPLDLDADDPEVEARQIRDQEILNEIRRELFLEEEVPEIVEPVNPRPPEPMPEDLTTFAGRLECPVCMTNAVNSRLNPCGHLICTRCYILLREPKNCPKCRQDIINDEAIFYGGNN